MKRLFFLLVFANLSFAQYDTIIVKAGWNNIGSVQTGMPPQIINTVPPGIITSPYYGYNPGGGYFTEDTLKRGGGYWIKCNQDGLVIFGVSPQTPTLSAPPNGTVNILVPPTLSWNPVNGADSYTLQVSTSDQFTSFVFNQSGLITVSLEIPGLNYLTQYFWRVSASNIIGTSSWSSVWSFTTTTSSFICGTTQINYSGKLYNTVPIGSQCWLKENLDVGTMINGTSIATNNGLIEKYCYNNDPNNCNTYGGLYQWNEAMHYTITAGTQGICPNGWHIPALAEFQALSSAVGGNSNALKAVGQGNGGGAGTNTSGFSALLAGYRYFHGNFSSLHYYADLWSSTEGSAAYADHMYLSDNNSAITLYGNDKEDGFSVRCLKD